MGSKLVDSRRDPSRHSCRKPSVEVKRWNRQRSSATSPTTVVGPGWPNPPLAGWRSTTASSSTGCATAAASPPPPSSACARSSPPPRPRNPPSSARYWFRGRLQHVRPPRHPTRTRGIARQPGAQLPLLRQSPEVSALRQHLLREGGHFAARGDGAREPPSASAGRPCVRCRRRRRLGAHAHDARDAQPIPDDAVLHRRQGDQPRGRAARAREDARPVLRAPRLGAGHDEPVLPRGTVAGPELGHRGHQPRLARGRAHGRHRARVRGAGHRARAVSRGALARPRQPDDRQPGVRAAGGARDLPRRPSLPARPDHPAPGRRRRQLRPRHRIAALPGAGAARLQGGESDRAAREEPWRGRAAARHPLPRQRPGSRDPRRASGRARTRSSTTGTRC